MCIPGESRPGHPQCFVPFINIAAGSINNASQPQKQQAFIPTVDHEYHNKLVQEEVKYVLINV